MNGDDDKEMSTAMFQNQKNHWTLISKNIATSFYKISTYSKFRLAYFFQFIVYKKLIIRIQSNVTNQN